MVAFPLITNAVGFLKLPLLATFIAWIFGEVTVLAFQGETPKFWYENPALTGPLLGLIAGILSVVINNWYQRRNKQDDRKDKSEELHQTYSTRVAELTYEERQEVTREQRQLHEREVKFYQDQLILEKISHYEARRRAHRLAGELQRLNIHVFQMHLAMNQAQLTIPEFKLRSYEDLMEGLDDEVQKYRETFSKGLNAAIHSTEG